MWPQGPKLEDMERSLGGENTLASFWDSTVAVATAAGAAGPWNKLGLQS